MAEQLQRQGTKVAPPGLPERQPPSEVWRLSSRDLYRLRYARQVAREAALHAQLAQHRLEALALELERRYGLLGRDTVIDVHTGRISLQAIQSRKSDEEKEILRNGAEGASPRVRGEAALSSPTDRPAGIGKEEDMA